MPTISSTPIAVRPATTARAQAPAAAQQTAVAPATKPAYATVPAPKGLHGAARIALQGTTAALGVVGGGYAGLYIGMALSGAAAVTGGLLPILGALLTAGFFGVLGMGAGSVGGGVLGGWLGGKLADKI